MLIALRAVDVNYVKRFTRRKLKHEGEAFKLRILLRLDSSAGVWEMVFAGAKTLWNRGTNRNDLTKVNETRGGSFEGRKLFERIRLWNDTSAGNVWRRRLVKLVVRSNEGQFVLLPAAVKRWWGRVGAAGELIRGPFVR
ncbi:MAG: hypothetical protein ACTS4V_01410 [Candidatus Hodgkinia cicadicola]